MAAKVHKVFDVLDEYDISYNIKCKVESKYSVILSELHSALLNQQDSRENILYRFIDLIRIIPEKEREHFEDVLKSTKYLNMPHSIFTVLDKMNIEVEELFEKIPYMTLDLTHHPNYNMTDSSPTLAPNNMV